MPPSGPHCGTADHLRFRLRSKFRNGPPHSEAANPQKQQTTFASAAMGSNFERSRQSAGFARGKVPETLFPSAREFALKAVAFPCGSPEVERWWYDDTTATRAEQQLRTSHRKHFPRTREKMHSSRTTSTDLPRGLGLSESERVARADAEKCSMCGGKGVKTEP